MRATPEEHEKWKNAAQPWSFNHWARKALNSAADKQTNESRMALAQEKLEKRERTLKAMNPDKTFSPDFK